MLEDEGECKVRGVTECDMAVAVARRCPYYLRKSHTCTVMYILHLTPYNIQYPIASKSLMKTTVPIGKFTFS